MTTRGGELRCPVSMCRRSGRGARLGVDVGSHFRGPHVQCAGRSTIDARTLAVGVKAPDGPSLVLGIVVAASFNVVETLAGLALKQLDPQDAFETLYLLGVVVVSTVWGLGLAETTSVASAIALAYLRNWPDRHFAPFNLENGVVVIFLVVALLTSARTRWR